MNHMLSPANDHFLSVGPIHLRNDLFDTPKLVAHGGLWDALRSSLPARIERTTHTVLLVEDDPELQKLMSRHLGLLNLRVLTASHYASALAHFESCTPDLACVDIGLPSESGFELCEHIRGPLGLKTLPIVVTSESDWPAAMAYAEEAGANAFLPKPFSMSELAANIMELLGAHLPQAEPRLPRAA
jgi:DNA-binding response OmpR family regulator